jgi:hypothetical protein
VSGGIYLLNGETLVEMRERPYDSEDILQRWLADYPSLLSADDQLVGSPRRWLLVRREIGIPNREAGGSHWALDHLFIDQDAVPTLVEVKRSEDTRIRREVVGQMLDYAANGVVYWPAERLRADFNARCAKEGKESEIVFRDALGEDLDIEEFWDDAEQNLRSGRIRLIFVSDSLPPELRRIIEFLNERMTPTEVVGIELKQYVGQDNLTTLVPRVIGQTEQARTQKVGGTRSPSTEVDWDYYQARLTPERFALVSNMFAKISEAVQQGGLGWTPRLIRTYFSFQRSGGYNCVGVDIRSERPVDFWIKLPLAPQELRRLGHDLSDPYPELPTRWAPNWKQWNWAVSTTADIPDVARAVEITSRYQPPNGPMPTPTS